MSTRPMFWSVRRELWENRSVYLAPLIVAAVVLFGSLIATVGRADSSRPLRMAPAPIMLTTILVGMFFALDALYGERRERSILFWKSLPVSDTTTVLSKAMIPLVVLPVIGFVLSVIVVGILLVVSPATSWAQGPDPRVMLYGLGVHVLWFAPIYGWLLLISAWARRAPILWAFLPPFLISVAERILFGTKSFGMLMKYRIVGAMTEAFAVDASKQDIAFSELTPLKFMTSAGLWLGLAFAALCLVATIRLRRNREPI